MAYSAAQEWPEPELLDLAGAPVPEYGAGSLADLLPTLVAGQESPVSPPRSPS